MIASRYMYRAIDKHGTSVDFLLTAKRDLEAAKRFFRKMLKDQPLLAPDRIGTDGAAPYLPGLSQSFSDQCASCVRRRRNLTSGYGWGFQTAKILSKVGSEQVPRNAIPFRIVRGKTLRQALPRRGQPGRPTLDMLMTLFLQ